MNVTGNPTTRVAGHGVCIVDGRIVLVRDRSSRTWGIPGGGVQWGEHPELAVIRETKEETGLDVEIDHLLGIHSNLSPTPEGPGSVHFVGAIYYLRMVGGSLLSEESGSTDLARCFAVEDLPGLTVNSHAEHALSLAGITTRPT